VPSDVYQAHRVRGEFALLATERSLLVSLLEFVEEFGANTRRLYDEIDDLKFDEDEARRLYLESDFEGCASELDGIRTRWTQITDEASELKRGALVWIYVTEWFVVTGAALGAGSLLWALMVRRRLYRPARSTRTYDGTLR